MSRPIKKGFYLHADDIFQVVRISQATDEVVVKRVLNAELYKVRYALFSYAYERVFKMGDVARLIGRHPRTMYRYESSGLINKPKCHRDNRDRMVRYYRMQDILEIHELISDLHQGRPSKSGRTMNNSLKDIVALKKELKERFK